MDESILSEDEPPSCGGHASLTHYLSSNLPEISGGKYVVVERKDHILIDFKEHSRKYPVILYQLYPQYRGIEQNPRCSQILSDSLSYDSAREVLDKLDYDYHDYPTLQERLIDDHRISNGLEPLKRERAVYDEKPKKKYSRKVAAAATLLLGIIGGSH